MFVNPNSITTRSEQQRLLITITVSISIACHCLISPLARALSLPHSTERTQRCARWTRRARIVGAVLCAPAPGYNMPDDRMIAVKEWRGGGREGVKPKKAQRKQLFRSDSSSILPSSLSLSLSQSAPKLGHGRCRFHSHCLRVFPLKEVVLNKAEK